MTMTIHAPELYELLADYLEKHPFAEAEGDGQFDDAQAPFAYAEDENADQDAIATLGSFKSTDLPDVSPSSLTW
jgi:hypothetical protein